MPEVLLAKRRVRRPQPQAGRIPRQAVRGDECRVTPASDTSCAVLPALSSRPLGVPDRLSRFRSRRRSRRSRRVRSRGALDGCRAGWAGAVRVIGPGSGGWAGAVRVIGPGAGGWGAGASCGGGGGIVTGRPLRLNRPSPNHLSTRNIGVRPFLSLSHPRLGLLGTEGFRSVPVGRPPAGPRTAPGAAGRPGGGGAARHADRQRTEHQGTGAPML